jgi:hypothetical protein
MAKSTYKSNSNPFQFSLGWLLAYLTFIALVSAGLAYGRQQSLATYGTIAAQNEWDTWRSDAKDMSLGAGPVRRREPKSLQPPALVLMRDHFAACLALALLLSTVLFGTFMFFVRGALATDYVNRDIHSRRRTRTRTSTNLNPEPRTLNPEP